MQAQPIPSGYCQCGCGRPAPIARQTDRRRGVVKGQPVRYVHGHQPTPPGNIQKAIAARRAKYANRPPKPPKAAGRKIPVIVHGHARRGGISSRTYNSWRGMRDRCRNPNHARYRYYGAIGIRVCERWARFENFLADMGERPEGMTLDRIDPYGDYSPENCRWATQDAQVANRRANPRDVKISPYMAFMVALFSTSTTLSRREMSEILGCSKATVCTVLRQRRWERFLPAAESAS